MSRKTGNVSLEKPEYLFSKSWINKLTEGNQLF